jgi:hypothetical protein
LQIRYHSSQTNFIPSHKIEQSTSAPKLKK